MADSAYDFHTRWLIPASPAEVADTLFDPADLSRWWPSVYLDVRTLRRAEDGGVGSSYELFTTGRLPYTLRWQLHVESVAELGCSFTATGDFVGRGVWHLSELGADRTQVDFTWKIRADKPLLRSSPNWLRPVFEANHDWAMRMGEESLMLELRRRAGDAVPPPRPPTPTSSVLLAAGGAVALTAGAAVLIGRAGDRRRARRPRSDG